MVRMRVKISKQSSRIYKYKEKQYEDQKGKKVEKQLKEIVGGKGCTERKRQEMALFSNS